MMAAGEDTRVRPLAGGTLEPAGENGVRLRTGDDLIEATFLAPDLIRLGLFPAGRPAAYESPAIEQAEWPAPTVSSEIGERSATLRTSSGAVRLETDPAKLTILDGAGREVAVQIPEVGSGAWTEPRSDRPAARLTQQHVAGTRYFGCGERTGGLEKTGTAPIFWNNDPPTRHTPELNAMYTSIPFVLALHEGRCWGMLVDNTGRQEWDLAKTDPRRLTFAADVGNLVWYVFLGPTPAAVLDRYTQLTGRTPLPPLWALGYQQSRYGYRSADEIRGVAEQFRRRDIPCDVIHFDIDYMHGYRVFTWDPERFPDPPRLLRELANEHFHVITIVDPGVKVDAGYWVYQQGHEGGNFCLTAEGREYHNMVWPGLCAFPDFTSERTRAWWGECQRVLFEAGVSGIWCDMDEPALFIPLPSTFPEDVVHLDDGEAKTQAQVHNAYGLLMARAAREGAERAHPDRRPVIITRSGYAGVQRYALQWMGDNNSWWQHLAMAVPQLQNMGLSGVAWCGVDIGGFGDDTTPELLTRWTEMGIFQPFCRNHSALDTIHQEPWQFGEPWESYIRALLKLRQRLLPYLYTLFARCHRSGAPIFRPLLYAYPEDETGYGRDDEVLLGDALLIAPIAHPVTEYRHVYLPPATWFHWWTGEHLEGPAHILAHAPLGRPAIYVRANTAVPLWPEMNWVGERPPDPLTFRLWVSEGEGNAELYEDAGEGYAYREGEYRRRTIRCRHEGGVTEIELSAVTGTYQPERERIEIEVHGRTRPNEVTAGSEPAEWSHDEETGVVTIRLAETATALTVQLH